MICQTLNDGEYYNEIMTITYINRHSFKPINLRKKRIQTNILFKYDLSYKNPFILNLVDRNNSLIL